MTTDSKIGTPQRVAAVAPLFGEKRYEAVKRRLNRERDEYQSKRLLSEQALDLCHAIEGGVACEQLTKCSVLAAQLRKELEHYEATRPLTAHENAQIAAGWKRLQETPFAAIEEAQATHRPASPNTKMTQMTEPHGMSTLQASHRSSCV